MLSLRPPSSASSGSPPLLLSGLPFASSGCGPPREVRSSHCESRSTARQGSLWAQSIVQDPQEEGSDRVAEVAHRLRDAERCTPLVLRCGSNGKGLQCRRLDRGGQGPDGQAGQEGLLRVLLHSKSCAKVGGAADAAACREHTFRTDRVCQAPAGQGAEYGQGRQARKQLPDLGGRSSEGLRRDIRNQGDFARSAGVEGNGHACQSLLISRLYEILERCVAVLGC
mmetsp:Transcript_109773/g.321387  ORF Transcript_109773/g.321387 Transcript_109773/m.321387 type:complete len:225 (-) Transcript_109773:865-1539(-)